MEVNDLMKIPYLKIGGRSIRYKSEDVISFMEGRRITFDEVIR